MKLLAILLICLFATSALAQQSKNVPFYEPEDNGAEEAIKILGGFVVGAFGRYTSIETCYDKTMGIWGNFNLAIKDFRDDDFISIIEGLKDLGEALYKIPDAIKACKEIREIASKLKSLAVYFAHPSLLVVKAGENIFWHSISIYDEVKGAISSYDKKDWFAMGRNLGKIVDLVFLQAHRFKNGVASEGTDFFDGFLHGADPILYNDTMKCIKDFDQETIDRLKADLKGLDWKNIDKSVESIEDITKIFTIAIKDCEASTEEAEAFLKKFKKAIETTDFIEAAKKIIKNPLKFFRMIENIQKDVDDGNYFDAGDIVGDFVAEVLKLHTQMKISELLKK